MKTVTKIELKITGGMRDGWIQEPHTYEVSFQDGCSIRVEAVTRAEALAESPRVAERMEAASRQFEITLAWHDRVLATKSCASQVVEYRKPAQAAA
jgi:hypothetical protein